MKIEKPQVLLVEDNPADANLVEEALAEADVDCDLSIMSDGAQAVDFIDRLDRSPALVLLDLNLPKIGGETVLERLRSSPHGKTAKVLVISSSDAPSDRERVRRLGATDYFRKPTSLAEFMRLGPIVKAML
jgi:DNA-binding response OmpR family regulator